MPSSAERKWKLQVVMVVVVVVGGGWVRAHQPAYSTKHHPNAAGTHLIEGARLVYPAAEPLPLPTHHPPTPPLPYYPPLLLLLTYSH